jgi:thiamine pyrophosphate-dependent acetolactate synthase large subunit-like protein
LVDVLERIGVTQIFGIIGDSLNPLADAVRHSKIEWVGVRHEEGAALAAAGQAKLTGRLGVCCGTTGPGSTHLVAGLYEANRDHAPVLALSGNIPRKMQGTEYFQTIRSRGNRMLVNDRPPDAFRAAVATGFPPDEPGVCLIGHAFVVSKAGTILFDVAVPE